MINRGSYSSSHGRLARFYKNVKTKNVFVAAMAISAVAIFLPVWLTSPTQRICQAWLAPGGRLMLLAARSVTPAQAGPAGSEEKVTDDQLYRMLTSLSLKLQELQAENQSLLGIRSALGPGPVLVPARVVGFDSLGLPSIEIDRGTDVGLKDGLPVLATIPLDVLQTENLDPKLAISAGVIVGTVDFGLGPYTARVKLITAADVRLYANVVRFTDGKTQTLARVHLQGSAKGDRMKAQIEDETLKAEMVPAKHGVQKGDFLIPEQPDKLNLPVPLVLGVVDNVDLRTDNRMLVDLTIRPLFQKKHLNKVYVLVTAAEPAKK
jgi:hypothetical protein